MNIKHANKTKIIQTLGRFAARCGMPRPQSLGFIPRRTIGGAWISSTWLARHTMVSHSMLNHSATNRHAAHQSMTNHLLPTRLIAIAASSWKCFSQFSLAALICLALFAGMAALLHSSHPTAVTANYSEPIDIIHSLPPPVTTITRRHPPAPPPPPATVPRGDIAIPVVETVKTMLHTPMSGFASMPTEKIVDISNSAMAQQDVSPIYRTEARYPAAAASQGIEGWVQLQFSIDLDGSVTDIAVIDAKPKRIFNQAAMQALRHWKYQPAVVDGRAVKQTGLSVQLDFKLDAQ